MNILFANYGDFTTNSINHIAAFANQLVAMGHQCVVAIPQNRSSFKTLGNARFIYGTFNDILGNPEPFPNSLPADILHAWTPRENVREFAERYCSGRKTRLAIHLEDNEECILESFYAAPLKSLISNGLPAGHSTWETSLSHPIRYKGFLNRANGITAIIDSLFEFAPSSTPKIELFPGLDFENNPPPPKPIHLRNRLKISDKTKAIVYTGGISSNNLEDVLSLYQAVGILNQRGWPTVLVKTGPEAQALIDRLDPEIKSHVIDLGLLPKSQISEYISLADVLVQPGKPDNFNDYRLPSKLPEYLAAKKPLILTNSNIAKRMPDSGFPLKLDSDDPIEIVEKCIQIFESPELAKEMAENGLAFSQKHFSLARNTEQLLSFYQFLLEGQAKKQPGPLKRFFQRLGFTPNESPLTSLEPIQQTRVSADNYEQLDSCNRINELPDYSSPRVTYESFCEYEQRTNLQFIESYDNLESNSIENPLISIIVPVFNPKPEHLISAIESALSQVYQNWELCLADDASSNPEIRPILERYANADNRIRAVYRKFNGHISAASNSALSIARGEFAALLDHDDLLAPHALAKVALQIRKNPDATIFYSDEDKVDSSGARRDPYFKPDWNRELFYSQNYFNKLTVYRTSAVKNIGGFREKYEGSQDWDLALRMTENCSDQQIVHIPEILSHWRITPGSTSLGIDEKNYAFLAAKRAIEDHLKRKGSNASVQSVNNEYWKILYSPPSKSPEIHIVFEKADQDSFVDTLKTFLPAKSSGKTNVSIIEQQLPSAFIKDIARQFPEISFYASPSTNFAQFLNATIDQSDSQWFLIANSRLRPACASWQSLSSRILSRPEVGMLGSRHLYPDRRISHSGIILGMKGFTGRAFLGFESTHDGYFNRTRLSSEYSAVSHAACMFKKSAWKEAETFDETFQSFTCSHIDFCLKLRESNYRILLSPDIEYTDYGDASSAYDKSPPFSQDQETLMEKWKDYFQFDPSYNPNLTLDREDFSLASHSRQTNALSPDR